jgi:hypothetical protein
MKRILIIICFFTAIAGKTVAQQVTADAGVTATVVEPVSLSKAAEAEYNNVAVVMYAEVSLTLLNNPKNPKKSFTMPATTGTYTMFSYHMTGSNSSEGYTFTVTLPKIPIRLSKSSDGKTMKVVSFASDPIINPGSGMIAGVYVSVSPENVTVNYN